VKQTQNVQDTWRRCAVAWFFFSQAAKCRAKK